MDNQLWQVGYSCDGWCSAPNLWCAGKDRMRDHRYDGANSGSGCYDQFDRL